MNSASTQKTRTYQSGTQTTAILVKATKPVTKRSSRLEKIGNAFVRRLKKPDLTFEQWARIEGACAPEASRQLYSSQWNRGW
jgi:hypothetical protein